METVLPHSWKEEFRLAAALRREDILHKEKMARFEAASRQRIEEARIQQKRREQEFAALEAAFAPPMRIAEVRTRFDGYDAKTVEALMDNRDAIDAVSRRLEGMTQNAHVLPDGRRVFKTMDGQRVFDEDGQELSRDLIDPDIIGDHKSKWEPYRDAKAERARLHEEKQELHAYQAKLDRARDRLDKGDITKAELNKMEADMSATMPNAVREKLGLAKPKAEAAPEIQTSAPPNKIIAESVMGNIGLGPSGPG